MPIDPRRWAVASLAATSCAGPSRVAIPTPAPKSDGVDLVVANDDTLRFVRAGQDSLVVTRTVTVPGQIVALVWAGAAPVVMINESEVGYISAAGYEPFPAVAAARWTVAQPDPLSEHMDQPVWQLIADTAGLVWQARCEWGFGRLKNDEISCDAWVYARVPSLSALSRVAPRAAAELPLPDIEPSTAINAEIVSVPAPAKPADADGVDADPSPTKSVLHCTSAGTTIEFPPEADRAEYGRYAFGGIDDLTWITTAPPMFRITEAQASQRVDVIFEGCDVSTDYGYAQIVGGPHDVIAMFGAGNKLSVRRHGRELGTLDQARFVSFAPVR